jgi:hypothetical protein
MVPVDSPSPFPYSRLDSHSTHEHTSTACTFHMHSVTKLPEFLRITLKLLSSSDKKVAVAHIAWHTQQTGTHTLPSQQRQFPTTMTGKCINLQVYQASCCSCCCCCTIPDLIRAHIVQAGAAGYLTCNARTQHHSLASQNKRRTMHQVLSNKTSMYSRAAAACHRSS